MQWPADVPPSTLRQPDEVSCGPTAAVAARMLLDPAWRPEDVATEIALVHRALTSTTGPTGRAQLPWPRALGTPPWALAGVLADLTGEPVTSRLARFAPGAAHDELVRRSATRPVAVYLGSPWLPRHVVLAYGTVGDSDAVRIFDPARGGLVTVAAGRWREHRVGVAGWSHLWFVV
jgi:hypothetical protein